MQDNSIAKKTLCRSRCHPEMRTDGMYKVLLVVSQEGEIMQANCECASGSGLVGLIQTHSCIHLLYSKFCGYVIR